MKSLIGNQESEVRKMKKKTAKHNATNTQKTCWKMVEKMGKMVAEADKTTFLSDTD